MRIALGDAGPDDGDRRGVSDVRAAHNREGANLTGVPLSKAARSYFDEQGPDLVGEYAPWIVDILADGDLGPADSRYLDTVRRDGGMASLPPVASRRRAREHRARTSALFGRGITVGEIAAISATDRHRTPEARAELNEIMERLQALSDRCRRQSLSMLVPMGQEMAYRYQETLISDQLFALRAFGERVQK